MRYVITGGSGYIGTRLVEQLSMRPETDRIAIADVRPPKVPRAKVEFHRTDVRDLGTLKELLDRVKPDALVHLAFILNPIRDEALMYEVDVTGTFNALTAASEAGTPQVLVTTSATAYGAFPDNPEPITEDWPVRGQPTFAYARHKAECDRLCQLWALEHPERAMTIVRPCIVFGPNVDNYIVRTYLNQSSFPVFRGLPDQRVQFVHEDDVAEAIRRLLDGRHEGAFNLAGDGALTWRETGERAGLKVREIPFGVAKRLNGLMWNLHVKSAESPPGNLEFIRHPWLTSNEKLKRTLGWTPRYSSQETFDITMAAHGRGAMSTPTQRTDEASGRMRDPAAVH